jgi:hypothetical protein
MRQGYLAEFSTKKGKQTHYAFLTWLAPDSVYLTNIFESYVILAEQAAVCHKVPLAPFRRQNGRWAILRRRLRGTDERRQRHLTGRLLAGGK